MAGIFITLEGTEGVGKSTVGERLRALLEDRGLTVLATREPGGTALGEHVRSWILDAEHDVLSADVEALLMFAARGYHLDNVIRPALARGECVVCDRFTDATFAYQGAGRGVSLALLESLRAAVHKGLEPDLTILLDAPVEVGLARIAGREKDHFEREERDFFERVRAGYAKLAADEAQRFRVVDASLSAEVVWRQVRAVVEEFMDR